jgi:GMP synthase-like glutamine amidotransferase
MSETGSSVGIRDSLHPGGIICLGMHSLQTINNGSVCDIGRPSTGMLPVEFQSSWRNINSNTASLCWAWAL